MSKTDNTTKMTATDFWKTLRDWRIVRQFLISWAFAAVGGVATNVLFSFGPRLYKLSTRLIGPHLTQVLIAIAVICMGVIAHWFKRLNQRSYGIVEVVFGCVSGLCIALSMTPATAALTQWASLVGCSYVVARGLNNMYDAKSKLNTPSPSTSQT
jgi:hypothetical protein